MIKVLTGDILSSSMQTKVNTVNCVGVMGKGIAKLFKLQYPEMYEDYVERCKAGEVQEGIPYLYKDIFGNQILNFPTKKHWKDLSNLAIISKGLDFFIQHYHDWDINSIAFPPLGCGNGGLLWQQVGPVMYQKLSQIDIPVEIYAPYGTERKYLTREFLCSSPNLSISAQTLYRDIRPGFIAILEILYRLEKMKYTVNIGYTIFQKICYLSDLAGIDTGLQFKKGKYGPYSPDINKLHHLLSRENLISIASKGNQIAIKTGIEYPNLRNKSKKIISQYEDIIAKVVDLFSRIKSTKHAEEIGTIIYALEELAQGSYNNLVSEMDFYNYILSWKKQWNTPEKKESIAYTIRYLVIQGWIDIAYSEELPVDYY
ncbi:MAG TPA: macro domain-containing protein [Candidatus Cloacimonas sp.]|nr:macro domain-containing protein [Candidatus Cloacimonas sp.]